MRWSHGLAAAAMILATAAARGQEGEIQWLAQEPAGIFPLGEETRILVRGIAGMIEVEPHAKRELRWSSTKEKGKETLPLAVGLGESEILLTAPDGDDERRRVRVIVPVGIEVRIEAEETRVVGTNVGAAVTVVGKELDVTFVQGEGAVEVDTVGGSVALDGMRGRLTLRGKPKSVRVIAPKGPIFAGLTGGILGVVRAEGGFDSDLEDTTLRIEVSKPPFRARARRGTIQVQGLTGDAEFELTGTPLVLEKSSGEIDIHTDAAVQFRDCLANIHVVGINASVQGANHDGLVEISTDAADVALSKIDGPVRIRGNSLKLRAEGLLGETGLITSGSEIHVSDVKAPLAIENELGDIFVSGATAKVEVKNREGNVTLRGLSAPVAVETSSEQVTVAWDVLTGTEESVLTNDGGEIRVEFPRSGAFAVEAETRYGTVTSSLGWVRVAGDGRTAQGSLGRAQTPLVKIDATDGVVLGSPGAFAERPPPSSQGEEGGGEEGDAPEE